MPSYPLFSVGVFVRDALEPVLFTSYLFLLLSWLLTSLDCSHVYYGKRLPMVSFYTL